MKTKTTLLLILFLFLLAASHHPVPVQAATITVTTTDDEVNSDGDCSLREAIIAANTDAPVDTCPAGDGADTIDLPAGEYRVMLAGLNENDSQLGDLDIRADLTITGAGRANTIIDANGADRAVHVHESAGAVEIARLTIRGGHPLVPGAVYVYGGGLTLTNTRVRDNDDSGVYVTNFGTITVSNTRIYDNASGGLVVGTNASATVLNSLISGNEAFSGAGISNSSSLTVINSTVSGNSADSEGGGIRNASQLASTTLINVTVTDNSGVGGGLNVNQGITTVRNSIIAGNVYDNGVPTPDDCDGDFESEGYNLIQTTTNCTISGDTASNLTGVDPVLGPLQNNGGPTLTHALLGSSPAIDAGNPGGCQNDQGALLWSDQRNYMRPVDGDGIGLPRCDIGAYEYDSPGPFPTRFVVERTSDFGDRNPGDGHCDGSVNVGDQCGLRAAIEEVNALGAGASPIRIVFDISGTGPHTFTPATPLPVITAPVFIDGASQPGASCPTATTPATLMIILDGSNIGTREDGLVLGAGSDGSTVSGLVIGNFEEDGIDIDGNDNRVRCNHLGVQADGVTPMGNGVTGVFVGGARNTIGGADAHAARNVISANGRPLQLYGSDSLVVNNFMGTTADGMSALGNSSGIPVALDGNIIGGSEPLARNVISGNEGYAFYIEANNTRILGNYIGVARDGVTPLPNGREGITIYGESVDNVIGGIQPGEGNVIAHHEGQGVVLTPHQDVLVPQNNEIRGNAIYDNEELGIELEGDSNGGQGYPSLSASPGSSIVVATLDGHPNTTYELDVYGNQECDPSGFGEGQQYLGTWPVTADASGQAAIDLDLTGMVVDGNAVTATATDPDGNTSEFSACALLELEADETATPTPTATMGPSPTPTPTATTTPVPPGSFVNYLALIEG